MCSIFTNPICAPLALLYALPRSSLPIAHRFPTPTFFSKICKHVHQDNARKVKPLSLCFNAN